MTFQGRCTRCSAITAWESGEKPLCINCKAALYDDEQHHDRERERRDRWCMFMAAAMTNNENGGEIGKSWIAACANAAGEALDEYLMRFPLEEPDGE